MRTMCLVIALAALASTSSAAAGYRQMPTEQLIDQLALIDSEAAGVDSSASFEGFMGAGQAPRFRTTVLPASTPDTPPQMRELVRRGVDALSALLTHLTDARPTGLHIHNDESLETFGGTYFTREYDPKGRRQESVASNDCDPDCLTRQNEIVGSYTVKVGDICFVLVGQIVNRDLNAVRYQPTALVFVNSPVHTADLAALTRKDWQGLTAATHRASLLDDLHDKQRDWLADGALERLRFYYPDTYANLSGEDARLRARFEAEKH